MMLQTLCDIFGYCEAADELYDRFANPKIKVGMEWVTKSCNLNAVTISISSIAKNIFGRLFRYLVDMCNNTLIDPTMKKVPDSQFFPRLVHYGQVFFDLFLIHHHRLISSAYSTSPASRSSSSTPSSSS